MRTKIEEKIHILPTRLCKLHNYYYLCPVKEATIWNHFIGHTAI